MGSKARFASEILPIILKNRQPNQWYVEPFCGGCNIIDKVNGNRLANDINPYLIAMWKALVYRDWKPEKITKEEYNKIRDFKECFEPYLVGWTGFNCSYSGKYFGGFAGEIKTKLNTTRDYQTEAINNVLKQIKNLKDIIFSNQAYDTLLLPSRSLVYCDPPYEGTTNYSSNFNHNLFWDWIRNMNKQGHTIFISEYKAPIDFECVWSKTAKSSLSANGKSGSNKVSVEKLFRLK